MKDLWGVINELRAEAMKERDERKVEAKGQEKKIRNLEVQMVKARDEQKQLEKRIERQEVKLERQGEKIQEYEIELRKEKEERKAAIDDINELNCLQYPLHLNNFLATGFDSSRQKIVNLMNVDTWDQFRKGKSQQELIQCIMTQLRGIHGCNTLPHKLSKATVHFLCRHNNVFKEGSPCAHSATKEDVQKAVQNKAFSEERKLLTELFEFFYDEEMKGLV